MLVTSLNLMMKTIYQHKGVTAVLKPLSVSQTPYDFFRNVSISSLIDEKQTSIYEVSLQS